MYPIHAWSTRSVCLLIYLRNGAISGEQEESAILFKMDQIRKKGTDISPCVRREKRQIKINNLERESCQAWNPDGDHVMCPSGKQIICPSGKVDHVSNAVCEQAWATWLHHHFWITISLSSQVVNFKNHEVSYVLVQQSSKSQRKRAPSLENPHIHDIFMKTFGSCLTCLLVPFPCTVVF